MTSGPVLSGKIPSDGVLGILRDIEVRRTSGLLRAKTAGKTYDLLLVAGHLAMEQPEHTGPVDPVEAVLALRSGTYELFQKLPELPISKGDDRARTGSLAVHVPADLMAYCEGAGLTGLLVLERDGRRVEAAYDRGELSAIRLDGRDDVALGEVFAWEEGTFAIEARATMPAIDEGAPEPEKEPAAEAAAAPEKPKRKDDTGMRFLRVVEVALTSIVEEREKRRSPTRTSPPLPPPPAPRARPDTEPPPPPRKSRPDTVKVIYLSAEESADPGTPSGGRHVRSDVTGETVLPDAKPERKSRSRSNTGGGQAVSTASPSAPSDTSEVSYIVLFLVVASAVLAALGALLVK